MTNEELADRVKRELADYEYRVKRYVDKPELGKWNQPPMIPTSVALVAIIKTYMEVMTLALVEDLDTADRDVDGNTTTFNRLCQIEDVLRKVIGAPSRVSAEELESALGQVGSSFGRAG